MVNPDEVEAQVDAGGHACRREDVAVVDEHAVRLDLDAWVAPLKLVRHLPMGRGGSSVEKTCRRQGEGSGADGHDSCAAAVRRAESGQDRARDVGVNVVVPRDDNRVCFFERIKAGCAGDGEP